MLKIKVPWDGSELANGVYFYRITAVADDETVSKINKLVIIK